jgi:hypothetical protein
MQQLQFYSRRFEPNVDGICDLPHCTQGEHANHFTTKNYNTKSKYINTYIDLKDY